MEEKIKQERNIRKEVRIFLILMSCMLGLYMFFMYLHWEINGESSNNEYLRTIDCAPEIDEYGVESAYIVEFELKVDEPGEVQVYFQMEGARYFFAETVYATTEFNKYCLEVYPVEQETELKEAFLSFYGGYGTGVKPSVKRVSFKVKK